MSYENKKLFISENYERRAILEFAEEFGYKVDNPDDVSLDELRALGISILSDTNKDPESERQIPITPEYEQISIDEYMGGKTPMINVINRNTFINEQNQKEVVKQRTRTSSIGKTKLGYKSKKC
ncbi:MAG: hypothetical protein J5634_03940 [Bacilli bacterium]|nr:hypothetical protein [Bacilli bacterium]